MSEIKSQEKVTIAIASKVLNVDRRTIYRWMDKGLLSKVKEGNSTYVLMDDVRALRDKAMSHDKNDSVTENRGNGGAVINIVTIERTHYEGLLTRLGQLEAKQELLLEYKAGIEAKDKTIATQQAMLSESERLLADKNKTMKMAGEKIRELEKELLELKRPWWRWFFKGKD